MAILRGLDASYGNDQNGMIRPDMVAAAQVADQLDEVIVFRSTGPWAKRWIERGHPTKNFHVKGKSSDWGPQAGCVPHDAKFSKKIDRSPNAADRTKANDKSEAEGWARKVQLFLTRAELDMQLTRREGKVTAIERSFPMPTGDILLWAGPHGGGEQYLFRAIEDKTRNGYLIHVYDDPAAAKLNPFQLADGQRGAALSLSPLYVMASNEVGAGTKAITGDYDLFTVVPTWASYGSQLGRDVVKPGIMLQGAHGMQQGQGFMAGVGMDNVLDPSLHTAGAPRGMTTVRTQRTTATLAANARHEHRDMGNITPRILRCINALNVAMGATGANAPLRRVHHNAESHRNAMFGALTKADMTDTTKGGGGYGDGFPLTAFLPTRLRGQFTDVCTLTTYGDLALFAAALHRAGYYVPKNWAWLLPKAFDLAN